MTDLFLGVDAGGTKTHAAVMDCDGNILGLGVAATGNWERVGLDASALALTKAVDGAMAQSGRHRKEITAATFALAGIDWDSDAHVMQGIVSSFGFGCTPTVMNDAFAVLYAGTLDGVGCASIAGTGGKTVARDGVNTAATLGMSLGEGGGAGQIVAEAMRILAEMHHGQRPTTAMLAEILTATGFTSPQAIFQAIARDGFDLSEAMAPLFFDLAATGDSSAVDVIEAVALQHARDVIGIVSQLDFKGAPISLVCAGGLHTAGSAIFDQVFQSAVAQSGLKFETTILQVVPVVGALIHAANTAWGDGTTSARTKLFDDAYARREDFRAAAQWAS
jgi:hypothetical protein